MKRFTLVSCTEYGREFHVLAFSAKDRNYFYGVPLELLPESLEAVNDQFKGKRIFNRRQTSVHFRLPSNDRGWVDFALRQSCHYREVFLAGMAERNSFALGILGRHPGLCATAASAILGSSRADWFSAANSEILRRAFSLGDSNRHRHFYAQALSALHENEERTRRLLRLHDMGLCIPKLDGIQVEELLPAAARHEQMALLGLPWRRKLCPLAKRDFQREARLLPGRLARRVQRELGRQPGLFDHCLMQYELWKDDVMSHSAYINQLRYACQGLVDGDEEADWYKLGRWVEKQYRAIPDAQ